MKIEGAEHFIKSSEQDFSLDERRRKVIHEFVEQAGNQPDILKTGMDIVRLNSAVQAVGAEDIILKEDRSFLVAKFDKNTIYVPARALKKQSGEVRPELAVFREYHGYLLNSLQDLLQQIGLAGQRNSNPEIVIGIGKKNPNRKTKILGGFHSPLSQQGYKIADRIVVATLEDGTDNREIYRTVNLLRAVTHDSLHSLQYTLYNSVSSELIREEEVLARLKADGGVTKKDLAHQQKTVNQLEDQARKTDLNIIQYATSFFGVDKRIQDFKGRKLQVSFGAVLFEYLTDKMARQIVKQYLNEKGQSLPLPQTSFEELEYRDFGGEVIQKSDIKNLAAYPDEEIAKHMFEYSQDIAEPAIHFFALLGSYREEAERAIFLDSISGKFNNTLTLGKKIKLNNYRTLEGEPLDMEEIKKFADVSAVVRALFNMLQ